MPSQATTLELKRGLAGTRYYLAGRLLNGGDTIQLCFSGGWVTGRYEWNPERPNNPYFHCSIELEGGRVAAHAIEIPDQALLRWP
jgi:hypothetical protein